MNSSNPIFLYNLFIPHKTRKIHPFRLNFRWRIFPSTYTYLMLARCLTHPQNLKFSRSFSNIPLTVLHLYHLSWTMTLPIPNFLFIFRHWFRCNILHYFFSLKILFSDHNLAFSTISFSLPKFLKNFFFSFYFPPKFYLHLF